MFKKIGLPMNILMSVTISMVCAAVGMSISGHFTIKSYLISVLISSVIAFLIGLSPIAPKKVGDAVIAKFQLTDGTVKANAVSALVTNLVMCPILSLSMITFSVTGANIDITNSYNKLTDERNSLMAEQSALLERQADLQTQIDENAKYFEDLGIDMSSFNLADEESQKAFKTEVEAIPDLKPGEVNPKIEEIIGMSGGVANMQNGIDEMQKGIDGMAQGLQNMENGRPSILKSFLESFIPTLLAGTLAAFILQPIYLKMILKKNGLI